MPSGGHNKLGIKGFIGKASKVHNNIYDYSNIVEYKGNKEKVPIVCSIHGMFMQQVGAHLRGVGCPSCKGGVKSTTEDFIRKASNIHGDKYDYSEVNYVNSKTKVKIHCPQHAYFYISPSDHIQGRGCNQCALERNDIAKRIYSTLPSILYYIKIIRGCKAYYKIGVTSKSVEERFRRDVNKGLSIEILFEKHFDYGGQAYRKERVILNKYSDYKTKDRPLYFEGNSEVFDRDIFNLDTTISKNSTRLVDTCAC